METFPPVGSRRGRSGYVVVAGCVPGELWDRLPDSTRMTTSLLRDRLRATAGRLQAALGRPLALRGRRRWPVLVAVLVAIGPWQAAFAFKPALAHATHRDKAAIGLK